MMTTTWQPKHPMISEETIESVTTILRNGQLQGFTATSSGYLGGPHVRALEKEFKEKFGFRHAIAVQSATAGLHASLLALGVGQGDEVIVSPYSFSSSASCVLMVGATPVFADVQDDIFNLDPMSIEAVITPKTKAIIPVHLCGHPADMNPIMAIARKYGLSVIEDAAQAIGATYLGRFAGSIGDCGVFSFNQSKHISSGEGGIVVTNREDIAEKLRAIRNHGEVSRPDMRLLGYNYRMPEIEACLCRGQLKTLDQMTDYRIRLVEVVNEKLRGHLAFETPVVYDNCRHVWYTYGLKVHVDKTKLCQELAKRDVYFGTYVTPLYRLPIYERFGFRPEDYPVTERLWRELIVTDCFRWGMTFEDAEKIADILIELS